jgi:hypothetical protein
VERFASKVQLRVSGGGRAVCVCVCVHGCAHACVLLQTRSQQHSLTSLAGHSSLSLVEGPRAHPLTYLFIRSLPRGAGEVSVLQPSPFS